MDVPIRFWTYSGNLWVEMWRYLRQTFPSDFELLAFCFLLFTNGFYIVAGGIFSLIDLTVPNFFRRYKIQDDKNIPLDMPKFWKLIKVLTFNLFVTNPLFSIPLNCAMGWRGVSLVPEEIPTFPQVLFNLILCALIQDALFYYTHRIFHLPPIYKRFHKLHHEWTSPIAITAIYAHPIEHICVNLLSVCAGPLILGIHGFEFTVWILVVIIATLFNHSGYHLPFSPISPEHHDFHHYIFNENFGTFRYLDWLHGTDKKWQASKQKERDGITTSFEPIHAQESKIN